ncbi:RraA family protein [Microbacterium esteraromaticum]|uniref:Putative 4-hydroxy-4-methyl-2-oxoglutarate aldolase n=2 Tax=Microbacterium esteraromaticum TaxID=57043 RepID=A0A7D8ABN6_9MICO|nr:RraA family protein [Microbacterium esteraromaticum]
MIARLLSSSTATLGHLTDFGFVRGLVPIGASPAFAGPALTVQIPHADSTAVHEALRHIRPGDVLVIDQSGDDDRSSFGGTLAGIALDAGAIAAVSNGRTNDVDEIIDLGFPVFSRGPGSLTTRILGLEGRINVPVAVGGVVVMPGDIVFGDSDGLCVIPRAEAEEIVRRITELDADPVILSLRESVRNGTPLGALTGASALFRGGGA